MPSAYVIADAVLEIAERRLLTKISLQDLQRTVFLAAGLWACGAPQRLLDMKDPANVERRLAPRGPLIEEAFDGWDMPGSPIFRLPSLDRRFRKMADGVRTDIRVTQPANILSPAVLDLVAVAAELTLGSLRPEEENLARLPFLSHDAWREVWEDTKPVLADDALVYAFTRVVEAMLRAE